MIAVSEDIAAISPYIPGKPLETLEREMGIKQAIKLASNENPLGPSPKAVSAIRKGLKKIQRYPDGAATSLKSALAEKWDISPSQITIGNGSNEIIELLVRTFILSGDEAIMAHPSFSLYRSVVTGGHGRPIEIPLKGGRHDLDRMSKAVTGKTKLIFICNPNNPTGTIVRHEEVREFLSQLPRHVLVVFDEAYAEYVTDHQFPKSVQMLDQGGALIVLRTFSKAYGLAGLRIGYGISHPDVASYMNRIRQPFNANLPAQIAAFSALSDEGHLLKTLNNNQEGKRYLTKEFDQMGIAYLPTETNFIYFDIKGSDAQMGEKVYAALLYKGVIIRHIEAGHLRVTIGRPNENRRFIRSLKEVLADLLAKRRREK